jgi:hypothetical protein
MLRVYEGAQTFIQNHINQRLKVGAGQRLKVGAGQRLKVGAGQRLNVGAPWFRT